VRRGLIAWSKTEVPRTVYDMRVAQAQAAMSSDGIEALLVYTNHTRPAAVSWLTGFVPYWSEAMLFLPRAGRPTLAAALTKRVHEWIAQTAWIEAIVSAPRLGVEIAKLCGTVVPNRRVGVLEYDALPTRIAEDLAAGGVGQAVDATTMFDRLRASADATEIALASRAARIAREALGALPARAADVAACVAAIDGAARRAGAEEVYVAVERDMREYPAFFRPQGSGATFGSAFSIRLTVAYKGQWIRLGRTVTTDAKAAIAVRRATEIFADAATRLPDPSGLGSCSSWLIEGTIRSQPLQALAASFEHLPEQELEGKVVTLSATVGVDGFPVRVVAPLIVGSERRAGALLGAPLFL
jgi:hypothetical protein